MNPARTPTRISDARRVASRAALALALAAVLAGCLGDRAPAVPAVGGPRSGQPADTLRFWALSEDPNGGNLSYLFDFGDSLPQAWTAELASGDTFFRQHAYADRGSYVLRVKARDRTGLESDWSADREMRIDFAGPIMYTPPTGPREVYRDSGYVFEASAGHITGDSVALQFDWGDGTGDWSSFVPPLAAVRDSHSWSGRGKFRLRARARDRAGTLSPWSEAMDLAVVDRPLQPPSGISVRSSAGVLVRISWETGRNSDSVEYDLWFRPLDDSEFVLAATERGTSLLHDPLGRTGHYTMSARYEEREIVAAETVSTVPVHTPALRIHELNARGDAGYGWNRSTGTGARFSMLDTSGARDVDFYFTDRGPGSSGPAFFLSSPSLGPTDPGGVVPEGSWRGTMFSLLWGTGQDPLPEFDSLLYEDLVDASVMETYTAVHTQDGYYGLVRNLGPEPDSAAVQLATWFQPVHGLRLLRHTEPERGR